MLINVNHMNVRKLNELIDGKKITKATIVRKTGISRPALDSILSGNDFKVSNLEKIADALNIKIGYLFDEDEKAEIRKAGRDYVEKGKIEHHGTEYNWTDKSEEEISQLKKKMSEYESENTELKKKLISVQEKVIELMDR